MAAGGRGCLSLRDSARAGTCRQGPSTVQPAGACPCSAGGAFTESWHGGARSATSWSALRGSWGWVAGARVRERPGQRCAEVTPHGGLGQRPVLGPRRLAFGRDSGWEEDVAEMVRALRVRAPRGRRPRTAVSPLRLRPVGGRTPGPVQWGRARTLPVPRRTLRLRRPPRRPRPGPPQTPFSRGTWPQAQRHWRVCALSVSGPAARGAVGAAAASGAPDSSVGCRPPCRWAERCPRAPAGAVCAVSGAVDGAASPGSAATPARAPEAGVRAPPHTRAPGLLVTVGRGCLRDRRAHVRRRRARSDADAVTAGGSRDGPGDQRGVGHQRSAVPCPPRGVAPSRSPGARNAYRSRPAQAHPGPWGGACVAGRGQAHAFVLQRRHRAPRGQVGVQRAPGGSPEGEHTGAPSKAQGSLGLL